MRHRMRDSHGHLLCPVREIHGNQQAVRRSAAALLERVLSRRSTPALQTPLPDIYTSDSSMCSVLAWRACVGWLQ